jgi:hypothetical protein
MRLVAIQENIIPFAPHSVCLTALFALLAAPLAHAADDDYLYFPVSATDNTHAIHLPSLVFGADGLLTAATRYPRSRNEGWLPEETGRAAYNVDTRLIDCETGFYAETATALHDKAGAQIGTRPSLGRQLSNQLEQQLRRADSDNWPEPSDIFLACAAASSATLKGQREARAIRALFVAADPAVPAQLEDSKQLFALARVRYDFSALEKTPPASTAALFGELRAQHALWRKSVNRAYSPAASDGAQDAAALVKLTAAMREAGLERTVVKGLKGTAFDQVYQADAARPGISQKQPANAAFAIETARTDCDSRLFMPFDQQIFDSTGKLIASVQLTARQALGDMKRRYGPEAVGEAGFDSVAMAANAGTICRLLAQARFAKPAAAPDALLYGVAPGELVKYKNASEMLLAIRSARRNHRP